MGNNKQELVIKKGDRDRIAVRGLGRSAWEKSQVLSLKEQIHSSTKKKKTRHRPDPLKDYEHEL